MSDKNTYVTFIDHAGRSIFGVVTKETKTEIEVQNPVMISVQQQENGQMAVQLFPLFFAEFVTDSETTGRNCKFTYAKSSVAVGGDFEVDPRIAAQYEKIVNPELVPVEPKSEAPIKLFDE